MRIIETSPNPDVSKEPRTPKDYIDRNDTVALIHSAIKQLFEENPTQVAHLKREPKVIGWFYGKLHQKMGDSIKDYPLDIFVMEHVRHSLMKDDKEFILDLWKEFGNMYFNWWINGKPILELILKEKLSDEEFVLWKLGK